MQNRILAGRYRLVAELGQGGMGSVWRAEHIELGTPAAVKLIEPRLARTVEGLTRFKREARAAAALRGAHVVQILDYGVDGDTPYLAMELLEGETLARRLEREGCLEPGTTVRILGQVGKAVIRAHEAGIVHRDLKPENIFLAREGDDEVVKVLDFGIAKHMDQQEMATALATRTGATLGTPYYMSPEQASGKRSVDARTDIWALAVIAFECLVGRRPFDSETLGGLVLAICVEPIPTPSSAGRVPAGFDEWFARATARDPAERFASVKSALSELQALCGTESGTSGVGTQQHAPPVDSRLAETAPAEAAASPAQITASAASVTVRSKTTAPAGSRWIIALVALALLVIGGGLLVALRSRSATVLGSPPLPTTVPSTASKPSLAASQVSGTPTKPAEPMVVPAAERAASTAPPSPSAPKAAQAATLAAPPPANSEAKTMHKRAATAAPLPRAQVSPAKPAKPNYEDRIAF